MIETGCAGDFKELVVMMKRRFLVDGSSEQGGSRFHDWLFPNISQQTRMMSCT